MLRSTRMTMVLLAALALVGAGCGGTGASGTGGTGGDGGGSGTVADGGGTVLPDGGIVLPDGGMVLPDGGILLPDGGTVLPDGGPVPADGGTVLPDGGPVPADGGATDGGWGPTADGGCQPVACHGHIYQCGDCIDNDHDGLIDWQDPDCLGPCDNNESGYAGNIPGQNNAPCKEDCYFDQDTGSGNDDCHWNASCDPLEPQGNTCPYPPSRQAQADCPATQSAQCLSFCGPLTPNGCDCFGCCELPAMSGHYVYIGSTDSSGNPTCTLANVSNPAMCHPCTPVKSCLKTCARCQLCIGKTTVPPDCFTDGGIAGDGGTVADGGGTAGDGGTLADGGGTVSDGGPTDAGLLPDGGYPPPDNGGDGGVTNPGQCPTGIQPCGLPGEAACLPGYYCITGCCQPTIP